MALLRLEGIIPRVKHLLFSNHCGVISILYTFAGDEIADLYMDCFDDGGVGGM